MPNEERAQQLIKSALERFQNEGWGFFQSQNRCFVHDPQIWLPNERWYNRYVIHISEVECGDPEFVHGEVFCSDGEIDSYHLVGDCAFRIRERRSRACGGYRVPWSERFDSWMRRKLWPNWGRPREKSCCNS